MTTSEIIAALDEIKSKFAALSIAQAPPEIRQAYHALIRLGARLADEARAETPGTDNPHA